jgi:hypothetical protein
VYLFLNLILVFKSIAEVILNFYCKNMENNKIRMIRGEEQIIVNSTWQFRF